MGISFKRIFWSLLFSFGLFGTMNTLEQQAGAHPVQAHARSLSGHSHVAGLLPIKTAISPGGLDVTDIQVVYSRKSFLPY